MRKDRQIDGQLEGRSDMTTLIVSFPNFANVPNNMKSSWCSELLYDTRSSSRAFVAMHLLLEVMKFRGIKSLFCLLFI